MSYFDPNLANPVTGMKGALNFTGTGTGTCNCATPVKNYMKHFGPSIGLAYQVDPKTVIHASYGVMFTHGNAVGGSSTSLGTLGFSAAPSFSPTGSLLSSAPFLGASGALPAPTSLACGRASGAQFGTGFYSVAGPATCGTAGTQSFSGSPSGMNYADPYLGGRAPEYINYTVGFQRQWTNALTSTITYVGSQGHFLPADGSNARGFFADQLDPKYLSLAGKLSDTGTSLTTDCASLNGACPANFVTTQNLGAALKPFPFQSVGDSFGYVANSNYHSLQTTLNLRASHGLTFMANYTWSRAIDNGGLFRSGYALPAGSIANAPNLSYSVDRIDRSLSTSSQPQHIVVTGVWELPIGKSILASNPIERAILGGYKFSEIFQAFSGSPMAVTGSSCQLNPALSGCPANLNPAFSGPIRVNGKWGQGITAANTGAISYIAASGGSEGANTGPFVAPSTLTVNTSFPNGNPLAPSYTFPNAARTAPYNLYNPGNYNLDIALVRSFPLHITESTKLNFRAEMYNVTNHTKFNVASTAVGNSSFGQVTADPTATRKTVQLSARIEF